MSNATTAISAKSATRGQSPPINVPEKSHMVHTFTGHSGRIFSLACFTLRDGTRVAASGSHDRTVRIWNLSNYSHIRTLEYSDFVWRVFIVNGSQPLVVAFVSAEDRIHVNTLETGEPVLSVTGRLIFAGNMPYFACPIIIISSGDDDLSIINAETGEQVFKVFGGFEKVFRAVVAHNPNLSIIVFTTWNAQNRRSTIQTFRLPEDKSEVLVQAALNRSNFQLAFEGDSQNGVTSVVMSTHQSKPLFCSGHYDSIVRVWELQSCQLLLQLEGHMDWVVSVAFWRSVEPIVVSGSSDGTIKVWDLQSGSLISTCEGHLRDVWSVTVTHKPVLSYFDSNYKSNGNVSKCSNRKDPIALIVSASSDRTVRVWDINDVIHDRKWNRRKEYCMFLVGCGLLFSSRSQQHDADANANASGISQESLETSKSVLSVFQSLALCREIASYL